MQMSTYAWEAARPSPMDFKMDSTVLSHFKSDDGPSLAGDHDGMARGIR